MADTNDTAETIADAGTAWAIVELMGHVRLAGRSPRSRSSVPSSAASTSRTRTAPSSRRCLAAAASTGSLWRQRLARHAAKTTRPEPVQPWDFPKPKPGLLSGFDPDEDDQEVNRHERD